ADRSKHLGVSRVGRGNTAEHDSQGPDQTHACTIRHMHHRWIAFVIAGLLPCSALLSAQNGWKTPRTVDGQPELQGVWNFSTITPLERTAEFAGREFLTDAETRAFEQRTMQQSNRDTRGSSPDADLGGAYNEFWWDRGIHAARVNGKARTSLIVAPPDGRIPALTADAQARATARAH